jgi:hypothetical protein
VGYLAVVASWLILGLQDRKLGQIVRALKDLPENQRLDALRLSFQANPRSGISSEQWLKSKRYTYLLVAFVVTSFVIISITAAAFWIAEKRVSTDASKDSAKAAPQKPDSTVSIAGGVSDNSGVVGNVAGNVYINAGDRHTRKLTRVEVETFLQANRGNIEACLSRRRKKYFYIDFVFLGGDDHAINVDIVPGEQASPEAVFMHPQLKIEEAKGYGHEEVIDEAHSKNKLSVIAPDVNGCIVGSIKNELDRFYLQNNQGFIHRYVTRTGYENGP